MTIFISRKLNNDSVFRQELADKATIIDRSLIAFKALAFEVDLTVDWLFFYSKNGVRYFFAQENQQENLPQIAVIGNGTATFLEKSQGLRADFVGTGAPEATAAAFLKLATGQRVAFVQAQQSKQSVQKLLHDQLEASSLVVYDNVLKTTFDLPPLDALVFTSPLNVAAYFSNYAYENGQKIVSIGRTTAKALDEQGVLQYTIAEEPTELALAKACIAGFQPPFG